ncbi:MAG: NAD(P)-dependent oxidoreductase [Anderseniella sp.]
MAASVNTLTPALKGCATMFPDQSHSPGSPAPDPAKPAFEIGKQFCAAEGNMTAGMARAAGNVTAGTPGEMNAGTAETALKLMLMTGQKLSGKTLGIVGFGRIGRETARKAHFGFGMKIVVHNRSAVPDEDLDKLDAEQVDDIDHLLGRSDFVSLHCPADTKNRHLIDALQLNKMKPDAYLINTAGGELVDEEALADALWHGTIGGAGLDVIHDEPAICDRLHGCENVVLLSHMSSTSQHARKAV